MEYIIRSGKAGEGYTPYGGVRQAFLCKDPEVMAHGPRDTGKTLGILHKLHVLATKYPGSSIVIARKQLTDVFSTVLQTFQNKVLHVDDPVPPYGGEKPQWFDYPNGSRIWVAGLDKPGKVLSAEHDIIFVNQAEEISIYDWEALLGSATGRAGHIPFPQVIGDCNPAAPTHWIQTRSHNGGPLTLIPTTHMDNPDLFDPVTGEQTEEGIKRLGRLKALTGTRRQRWFLGLWVAPEGAIYSVFDQDHHKVKAFRIPHFWPRFVGIDPIGAYIAAVWVAFDPKNNILNVYREYYQPYGLSTQQHVENILRESGYGAKGRALNPESAELVYYWVCGAPSERQQRLDFQSHGLPVSAPAFGDLWGGIDKVNGLLAEFSMVVHDTCPQLLSEIGDYRRVIGRDGIPTDSIENKGAYHLLDALRYAIVGPEELADSGSVVIRPLQIGQNW